MYLHVCLVVYIIMCLAVPGKIISIDSSGILRMGEVDFAGNTTSVCLEWLPEAGIGDYVLAHVGTALSVVEEEDALATIRDLQELGEI